MPQVWSIRFSGPSVRPAFTQVHAVVSRLLDSEHHSPRKAWALRSAERFATDDGERGVAVKVALLDDSLADPLRQGLGRLKDLRLGSHRYCVEDSPVLAKATSWSELALQPASSSANEPEWELHFSTPIIFRSGRKTVAPSPGLVLGHYRAVWTEFSQVPIPALNFGERLSAGFIGSTVPVGGEVGWGRTTGTGFIGSASLRVADPDAETVAIISALTALAPFCGTGSSTTFGCGVTDLVG